MAGQGIEKVKKSLMSWAPVASVPPLPQRRDDCIDALDGPR